MSSASSNSPSSIVQFVLSVSIPIVHVLGLDSPISSSSSAFPLPILHRQCPRRPRRPHSPSTMSSASSNSQFHVLGVLKFPILHVLGVLKSSIPHRPSSNSSSNSSFPIDHVLGVDSPSSSASSAFPSPILQPPARPQILNFPSIVSSAPSFPIHHVLCVDSPCSSMSLRLRILHGPARPRGLAFSILRSSSDSPRPFPCWRSVPVRHTKSNRS